MKGNKREGDERERTNTETQRVRQKETGTHRQADWQTDRDRH